MYIVGLAIIGKWEDGITHRQQDIFFLFRTSSLYHWRKLPQLSFLSCFVATKVCLSGQKLLSRYIMFVATNTCWQNFCHDKYCRVKHTFVATKHNNACQNFCRGKIMFVARAGIALVLECRTRDRKVPGSSPGRSGGRTFFSSVHFLCWLISQWHVNDPGHSAKSAGGRLQLNTQTPYLCGVECNDTVNWCVVKWCTQNLRRNGSIHVALQSCNNQRALPVHNFREY